MNNKPDEILRAELEAATERLEIMKRQLWKASQLPFFSKKVQKRIAESLRILKVLSDAEYRNIISENLIDGANLDELELRQQIDAYDVNTKAMFLPSANIIIFKSSYLSTSDGLKYGFDLLAEEVGHSLRIKKPKRKIMEILPNSILSSVYKSPDQLIKYFESAHKSLNLSSELPESIEDILVEADGFAFNFYNQNGESLPKITISLILEEMRASILQVIFEISHFGLTIFEKQKHQSVNHFKIFQLGAEEISNRSYSGVADYTNERAALGFIVNFLAGLESKEFINAIEELVTNLTKMDFDTFNEWVYTKNPEAREALTKLFYTIINYKKSLLDSTGPSES